jgi:hypothetical protein
VADPTVKEHSDGGSGRVVRSGGGSSSAAVATVGLEPGSPVGLEMGSPVGSGFFCFFNLLTEAGRATTSVYD